MYLTNIEISTLNEGIRYIKANILALYNTRAIPQYGPPGLDSAPVAGTLALSASTATQGRDVIVGYQNINQVAQPGETILYSQDAGGNYRATATMRTDGTMELLGTGDFLVRYFALNTALQSYFTSLNTAITAGVSSAGGAYTPPPAPDLTTAKVDKIKTTST